MSKKPQFPEYNTPAGKESLRENAFYVVKTALIEGVNSDSMKEKLNAMKIYESWNNIEENNKVLMLNSILTATPEQIKILEGNLKKEKAIDDIKSGKPDIQNVYGLPKENP